MPIETSFRHRRAIVRITSKAGTGTGFWIKGLDHKWYILSCAHVVGQDTKPVVAFCQHNDLYAGKVPATITKLVPANRGDIVVLQVEEQHIPKDAQALELLDTNFTQNPGFSAFGFPTAYSVHGRVGYGKIMASITNNDGLAMYQLETQADVRQGFSGGPLIYQDMPYVLGIINEMEPITEHTAHSIHYALSIQEILKHTADLFPVIRRSPYQTWLASQYHELVMNDDKGMRLSDIYEEPYYGKHEYCVEINDTSYSKINNGFYVYSNSIHPILLDWLNGLKHQDRGVLLLLGYPGQGKTSLTKKLLHEITQKHSKKTCYQVRLRRISDPRELKSRPFETIIQAIKDQANIELEGLHIEVNLQNAFLVLDGLDELSIKNDMSGQDMDEICQVLTEQSEKYPGIKILLTSRYGYINLERFKRYPILILQLSEFNIGQQQSWLKKYRFFHPESHLTNEKIKDYHEEEKFDALKELITQPILLQMVASLSSDISNSVNRSAIYTRMFNQLVERPWAGKHGQISILKEAEPELLRSVLQDVAFEIFHSEKGYLYKSRIEQLGKVKDLQKKVGPNIDMWRVVMVAFYMDEVKKGHWKEQESDRDYEYAIEFLHKSLSEYLCAEKIWREIQEVFLKQPPRRDKLALDELYQIFKSKIISQEIVQYLIQIIQNDQEIDKKILFDHLTTYFQHFLERNFYTEAETSPPLNTIKSIFYGYWTVLGALELNINLIEGDINRDHFERLIKLFVHEGNYYFNLNGQHLDYFNLRGGNLTGFKVTNAKLLKADLSNVSLENADLSNSELNYSNLQDINLNNSIAKYSYLIGVNLNNSSLKNINLDEATANHSSLINVILESSSLEKIQLIESNLSSSNLRHVDLEMSNLNRSIFKNTDLSYANLNNTNLQNANLEKSKLKYTNLQNANLQNTLFINANLTYANLNNSNLSISQLTGAKLESAHFKNANLHASNLNYANLEKTNFDSADLSYAYLNHAKLINTNFKNANLNNANFNHTKFINTNLENAVMFGTRLMNSDVTNATNLTLTQLQSVKTLYNCIGIPPEIESQLRTTHPHLFEDPENPRFYSTPPHAT